MILTIDEVISRLTRLKQTSKLGGNTCCHVCIPASEIEYLHVQSVTLEQDDDGAVLLFLTNELRVTPPTEPADEQDLIEIDVRDGHGLYAVKGPEGWRAHMETPEISVGPLPTAAAALEELFKKKAASAWPEPNT